MKKKNESGFQIMLNCCKRLNQAISCLVSFWCTLFYNGRFDFLLISSNRCRMFLPRLSSSTCFSWYQPIDHWQPPKESIMSSWYCSHKDRIYSSDYDTDDISWRCKPKQVKERNRSIFLLFRRVWLAKIWVWMVDVLLSLGLLWR